MQHALTIIGAGIAGPLLARILHKRGIAVTVLEADTSLAARHQGGMLNLNEGTGKPALKAAGLYEAAMQQVLDDGDALCIRDRNGKILFAQAGDGVRPEIDRGTLRRLVVQALPEGVIRWNSRVQNIARQENGFRITLADGTLLYSDAIIGADGAWSKVRTQMTKQKPVYTGITFVELRYADVSKKYPELDALVGDGTLFALSPGQGVIAHREPRDEVTVYAALSVAEESARKPFTHQGLLDRFKDWDACYRRVLSGSDSELISRPIHALPTGVFWPTTPGMTLIGDAAHVMSPFAGEGVNLAMADAADLASAIVSNPDDIDVAFASYESKMAERATRFQIEASSNMALAFGEDAPAGFLAFFEKRG